MPSRPSQAVLGALRRGAGALDRLGRDNVTGAASQFAYSAFLATVPFLAVCVAIVGIAGSRDTIARVINSFGSSLPDQVADQLNQALVAATRNTNTTTLVLVLGGALGLYVTSGAIGALVRCLEDIEGRPHRSWYESRLVNLGLALAAIVLVLVTTAALVGGPRLIDAIADSAQLGSGFRDLAKDIIYPIGIAGIVAFTLILYRYGPFGPPRRPAPPLAGDDRRRGGLVGGQQALRALRVPLRPLRQGLREPGRGHRLPGLPLADRRDPADRGRGQRGLGAGAVAAAKARLSRPRYAWQAGHQ